ncbi:hypothetical protein BASA81_001102 [Batrachochytrium salamandrivorans]|nr:hypothetical protein BASA81_001102 [Batrachochytrium salamandrivorans]
MFHLPLEYDKMSPMARLDSAIRAKLDSLFARVGKRYHEHYLKVMGDSRSNAARATVYVLNEGVVDSPRCFSYSKYKHDRMIWITPNGWQTAAVACSLVFVGEAKVIDDRLQYRFSLAHGNTNKLSIGQWHVNLQAAFMQLNSHFSERNRLTLHKLSKEVVLGVHTNRVQHMLRASWEVKKLHMTAIELTLCRAMEAKPQLDEYDAGTSAVTASKRSKFQETPRNPHGLLTQQEVASVLFKAERSRQVSVQDLSDALFLLEAGLGVRMDYFVNFLHLVEHSVAEFWAEPIVYWAGVVARQADMGNLELRAAMYVYWKAMDKYPTAKSLVRQKDFSHFRELVIGLPSAAACAESFYRILQQMAITTQST